MCSATPRISCIAPSPTRRRSISTSREAGPTAAKWIVRLGRFGIAARAVVFAMIGVFLIRAGMQEDSGEAGGIAQSLRVLGSTDHGRIVLSLVAFGLIAYGIYQLATARYRHMRAVGTR